MTSEALTMAGIAAALRGKLVGDGALPARAIVQLHDVGAPTDLALATERDDMARLPASGARIAVVAEGAAVPAGVLAAHIEVRRPRHALAILSRLFDRPIHASVGRHPSAVV